MHTIKLENVKEPTYLRRESINQLRTNIRFVGNDIKTILVTSSGPDEGKSTVAFDLSRSLAEEGKKVCFVDADLRKSTFNVRYKVSSDDHKFGLSHILAEDPETRNSVSKTNIDNLDIITTGANVADPTFLFNSERMNTLLTVLRRYYDYTIIDTAPLGPVIDAAILAPKCDGTILVVEYDKTSRRAAQKVVKQLRIADANILGVVLNKSVVKNNKSYYYYNDKK